jgi:prevent-host-death family protein
MLSAVIPAFLGRYSGLSWNHADVTDLEGQGQVNEYVDSVAITHDQVTITKNGSPAAVLIGADEWESIQETLFWLSQPGIRDTIAEADGGHRGRTNSR